MRRRLIAGHRRRGRPDAALWRDTEAGASLVIALAFVMGTGVVIVALLGYVHVGNLSQKSYRQQRTMRYAADAAIESAIEMTRLDPALGIDSPTAPDCGLIQPGVGQARNRLATPAITVTCDAPAGSGSGLPVDPGAVPEHAILTTGQRDHEAPSTQGSNCVFDSTGAQGWDNNLGLRPYGSVRLERGIRVARPSRGDCGLVVSRPVNQWQVNGKVFSNSPIVVNPGGGIQVTAGNTVQARGGCVNMSCSDPGRTNDDPMRTNAPASAVGTDPRTFQCNAGSGATRLANQQRCLGWELTRNAAGQIVARASDGSEIPIIKRNVPSAADCGPNKVVRFLPGWYDNGAAMNNLFKNAACKNTIFWFMPQPTVDGTVMGDGYTQGIYYFDFTDGNGTGCNWYDDSSAPSNRHMWCIGNGDDFNQRVVGGTPFGWNPETVGTGGSTSSTPMNKATIDGWGTSPIWSNQNGARQVSLTGSPDEFSGPAVYNNDILAIDRNITLQDFSPKVPSGVYSGAFNVRVHHSTPSAYNNPQITVTYDSSLFGSRTCGSYTLHKGDFLAAGDSLSAADATALGQCLDEADKINGVKVRFTVGGCNFFCSPDIRLDGMVLEPGGFPSQPTFPRPPQGDDPGGDCDDSKPGVQFVFGGDSHVYVADGSLELCAGPAAHNTAFSQQIAVYGVPSLPPLRATGSAAQGGASVSGTSNAQRIGEPAGPELGAEASISYGNGGCDSFCSEIRQGGIRLTFPRMSLPAGTEVSRVYARATYDSNPTLPSVGTGPELELPCSGRQGFPASGLAPFYGDNTHQVRTLDSCMHGQVTGTGSFNVTWWARGRKICAFWICNTPFNDQLDGVEIIVEVKSSANQGVAAGAGSPYPVPQSGCITAFPNYWGSETDEDDCALLKADSTQDVFNPSQSSQGRMSIKGTIYAPSAPIDVDDADVLYPWFNRGLVARTLMVRGFRYRNAPVPVVDVPEINTDQRPREVVYTACTRGAGRAGITLPCDATAGDRIISRARVRFELDRSPTANPRFAATVPKVQWWTTEL